MSKKRAGKKSANTDSAHTRRITIQASKETWALWQALLFVDSSSSRYKFEGLLRSHLHGRSFPWKHNVELNAGRLLRREYPGTRLGPLRRWLRTAVLGEKLA